MMISSSSAAEKGTTPVKHRGNDLECSFRQNEEETLNLEAEGEYPSRQIEYLPKFARAGHSFQEIGKVQLTNADQGNLEALSFAQPFHKGFSHCFQPQESGEEAKEEDQWEQSKFNIQQDEESSCKANLFCGLYESDEDLLYRNDYDSANIEFSKKGSNRYIRWSKKEHEKFIEGLRALGKNWNLIHKMIGTRSSDQTRSHAQKYFKRLEKVRKNPDGLPFITDTGKVIEEMLDKHTRRIIGYELPKQFAAE